MGKAMSNLNKSNVDDANKFSHFPPKDVQEWSATFKKHFSSGYITQNDLELMFKRFFPFGNPKKFASRLFSTINISQSNQIDFHELLIGFSILMKGSDFEKLRWMFRFYDEDNDGVISRSDLLNIVQGVSDMVSDTLDISLDVHRVVNEVFCTVENQSGFLAFDDFKELSVKRNDVFKKLTLFVD